MAFENRYSALDRLLHKLAFSTRKAQIGLADVEDIIFRDRLARHELDRPLFITALPRAGTTLLLELCVASGEFASHTYRHMPFILIPMLWNRFSEGFRRSDAPRERAHGDGMLVSVDSPEAFEETAWIAFWPKHYKRDRIIPWREEEDGIFRDFLENHFKKIVALSAKEGDGMADLPNSPPRYVSKNNLNIARIAWLARNFRDALFLIPFRDPSSALRVSASPAPELSRDSSTRSLRKALHGGDRTFRFRRQSAPGGLRRLAATARSIATRERWASGLNIGVRPTGRLSKRQRNACALLNYDAFCADPRLGLERVANFIDVENKDAFLAQAERIHAPSSHEIDGALLDETLVEEAKALYSRLAAFSIV